MVYLILLSHIQHKKDGITKSNEISFHQFYYELYDSLN